MNYIYARMSSNDKTKLTRQIEKVSDFCNYNEIKVDAIFKECFSGRDAYDFKNEQRKELNRLLRNIGDGDLIICQSVSRLSRRGKAFVKLALELIHEKGANIYFIIENLLSSEDTENMILIRADEATRHNYMFSELQKDRYRHKVIKEHSTKQGKKKNEKLIKVAIDEFIQGCGNRSKTQICEKYKISRPTFDKYLKAFVDENMQ